MDILDRHIYFSVLCGLLILGIVIELIRAYRLQERYAALWIVVALGFTTYGWWIDAASVLKNWLRIGDVVTIVLFLGIFMCAMLILQLSVKISRFSYTIKNLIQEVSLLKHKLEYYEKETSKPAGGTMKSEDV